MESAHDLYYVTLHEFTCEQLLILLFILREEVGNDLNFHSSYEIYVGSFVNYLLG